MLSDHDAMGLALEAAQEAERLGDVPIGAVVMRHGDVVAIAGNRREVHKDPTAHAEVLALRQAADLLGQWRLDECELFVTLEPCAMCAGAIVNARVQRVVIGAMDPKAGAVGSRYNLFTDPRLNHEVTHETGIRAEESAELLRRFFAARR